MKYLLSLVVVFGLITISCNDSIEVGSEILNNTLDVQVDTIETPAKMIYVDSVITFTKTSTDGFSNSSYMIGELEDSEYGNLQAVTYFNVSQNAAIPTGMADMVFDSVVMVLPYDTLASYGPDRNSFEVSLFQLSEPFTIENDENLYAEDGLEHLMLPEFSGVISANHRDSVIVDDYLADSTGLKDIPQLRLRLDPQKWINFFQINNSDTLTIGALENELRGYALKANSADKKSLMGLSLFFTGGSIIQNIGDIKFYIRNDSTRRVFDLPLGRFRQNQFIHDYAGSDIESIINSGSQEEFYIQSQSGVEVEFDLSELKNDSDFILNSATMEITVISSPDEADYPLPGKLFAKHVQDGNETAVIDVSRAEKFTNVREVEINGEMVRSYSIDITDHATLILDDAVDTDKIILFPSNKFNRPNRVKICGPDHPIYPTRMKLVKTTL